MRTVPAAIDTGFANGLPMFYVVKIEASGGNTYYWVTATKNNAGNTLVLKETSGGSTLTYDATMIAKKDLVTGEEYDGIGAIESGADIYSGGTTATVGDTEIQVLNHGRFDSTIIQAGINIENRPVTIYFGFIPDGTTPTVVLADDVLKTYAGVIEDVMEFNYQNFVLRCVDGTFQRHIEIPKTFIDKITYPRAPKESIGKPIPILYGNFIPTDEETERKIQTISPAPTIIVDDVERKFLISEHGIHSINSIFNYSSAINLFGKLTPDNTSLIAAAYVDFKVGNQITAIFYQQLKTMGVETDDAITSEFPNAVDENLTNMATLDEAASPAKQELAGQVENTDNVGTLTNIQLSILFGTITGTVNMGWWDTFFNSLVPYTSANNNTEQTSGNLSPTSYLLTFRYGASVVGQTEATAQIKNMYLRLTYRIANFARYSPYRISTPRGADTF